MNIPCLRLLTCVFCGPLLAQADPVSRAAVLPMDKVLSDPFCQRPRIRSLPERVLPAGTQRMVQRLATLQLEAWENPHQSPFFSEFRAIRHQASLWAALASGDHAQSLILRPRLAEELLNAGFPDGALHHYRAFRRVIDAASWRLDARQSSDLAIRTAVACLRLGELENCLQHHHADSCLLPLREGAVHAHTRGSSGAIRVLSEHLEANPGDLQARWLLNIAHMTLGEYPRGVRAPWLIPPEVFASGFDVGRFTNVAAARGVAVDDLAGGSIVEDFDADGFLDVMASSSSLSGQLRLFRNTGHDAFVEVTDEACLTGLTGGLNIVSTDYNNDGCPDVLVLRGGWLGRAGCHPNSLLVNRGDGTFEDVTEKAGLLSFHPTQTAAWFDFNSDGWLDVFLGNESSPDDPHPCELYRNNRNGTFTECAGEAGLALTLFVKAVVSGDFNNDDRPDLYVSVGDGPNLLLRNDGAVQSDSPEFRGWHFEDVALEAGVTEPRRSFPTWFWDYNNDGWLDLFVSGYGYRDVGDIAADYLGLPNHAERARLYRNEQNGQFTDVTSSVGLNRVLLAMGGNFGDLDNDGWLDFYVGTGDPDLATVIPNRMFRGDRGSRFHDVTTSGGFGHLQKGHGVSFADLDNDGDQDVYHVLGGALPGDHYPNALFLNPGHGHRWITLRLEGTRSNRAAIGARVTLLLDTSEGTRSIHRTVGTGGSFGASPFRTEIGCGNARSVRSVEVRWPATRKTEVFTALELDRIHHLREGEGTPR
jgi:hypothetical protein